MYFSVDFDAYEYEVEAEISGFFKGVSAAFEEMEGIYGVRNTCQVIAEKGYVDRCFVSGTLSLFMSTLEHKWLAVDDDI